MTPSAEGLARQFHEVYERLAPQYGYVTRPETRTFDPQHSNGRLMIAVCTEVLRSLAQPTQAVAWRVRRGRGSYGYCDTREEVDWWLKQDAQVSSEVEPLFAHPPSAPETETKEQSKQQPVSYSHSFIQGPPGVCVRCGKPVDDDLHRGWP